MSAVLCAPVELQERSLATPHLAWPAPEGGDRGWVNRLRWALADVRVLTWRTFARIATTPEQVLNVTVQPLVFVLLFSYVTVLAGLAVGWRIHASAAGILLALALLFAYSAAWAGACVGLIARGPESAQAVGLTVIMPLSLTSNAFIPTASLPGVLSVIANWNPVSVLASACRQLLGNPDPAAAIHSWPMQHPELASALWSLALLAAAAPLATWLYIHRTRR
jgi:ABC-type multidrug transport system permease subunit